MRIDVSWEVRTNCAYPSADGCTWDQACSVCKSHWHRAIVRAAACLRERSKGRREPWPGYHAWNDASNVRFWGDWYVVAVVEAAARRTRGRTACRKPPKTIAQIKRRKTVSYARRQAIGMAHDWTCAYCGMVGSPSKAPNDRIWHIDHVIPWSKGGSDDDDNLVLACEICNLKKHDSYWSPRFGPLAVELAEAIV